MKKEEYPYFAKVYPKIYNRLSELEKEFKIWKTEDYTEKENAKEIAELREHIKVYSNTQSTILNNQEKLIDQLNELKERDLQLREIIRHWNPDIRANSLRLNDYKEVLWELGKHLISALLILNCPQNRIEGIENTIAKLDSGGVLDLPEVCKHGNKRLECRICNVIIEKTPKSCEGCIYEVYDLCPRTCEDHNYYKPKPPEPSCTKCDSYDKKPKKCRRNLDITKIDCWGYTRPLEKLDEPREDDTKKCTECGIVLPKEYQRFKGSFRCYKCEIKKNPDLYYEYIQVKREDLQNLFDWINRFPVDWDEFVKLKEAYGIE